MTGIIHSIQVKPRTEGERGLPKEVVEVAWVSPTGLAGDFNLYRSEKLNGDLDSAVLLLPLETIGQLNSEGWPVKPGDLGENITTSGISYASLKPGSELVVADWVRLQVSRACNPCGSLRLLPYIGEEKVQSFIKTLTGRRGWFCRVLAEGEIRRSDTIQVL